MTYPNTTERPVVSPPRWPDPIVVAAARQLHYEGFRHQVIRYGAVRHLWTHPAGIEITGYANGDDTGTMSVTLEGDLQARLLHVTTAQAVEHLAPLELRERLRQRRLAQAQRHGGTGKAAVLGEREHPTHLSKFESHA